MKNKNKPRTPPNPVLSSLAGGCSSLAGGCSETGEPRARLTTNPLSIPGQSYLLSLGHKELESLSVSLNSPFIP